MHCFRCPRKGVETPFSGAGRTKRGTTPFRRRTCGLTLVRERDYDSNHVADRPSRKAVSLAAVRDAATAIYRAAVRTPLLRLDLRDLSGSAGGLRELYLKLEVLQPIGSFKIRGAYNVVRQLTPEQLNDGVWTVSAGNAAQGVAFAARRRRALLGDGDGYGAGHEAPRDRAARREDRPATYDECWRTVEAHGSDRMTRPLRSPVRRRSVHRRERHRGTRNSRGPARRRRDRRAARRRRTARRASPRRCAS